MRSQKMDYYPEQKAGVSDKDYKYGMMVLKETYDKVKQDKGVFNYVDYWNLCVAYHSLKEGQEIFKEMLYKSKEMDPDRFAEIFLNPSFGGENFNRWDGYLTEEEFQKIKEESAVILSERKDVPDKTNTCEYDKFDQELISILKEIDLKDSKYRGVKGRDLEKQRILDKENLAIIDSLYKIHDRYIGKDLVGDRYKHVMWSVIQHSNFKAMERYLPVVHEAVVRRELSADLLKLLVDRVYAIKCKYQIFGTQANLPIGPEIEIAEIRAKYDVCTYEKIKKPPHKKRNTSSGYF